MEIKKQGGGVQSILIRKAEDLPKAIRDKIGISTGFVEIRVERNSLPNIKIIPLDESPAQKIRGSIIKAGLLGTSFSD